MPVQHEVRIAFYPGFSQTDKAVTLPYVNIHLSTRNQPNIVLRDFIEHHLSRGGLYHYDRDSLQESKEDISREYPLLKTRDNLNSDYLYNLFKKIAE